MSEEIHDGYGGTIIILHEKGRGNAFPFSPPPLSRCAGKPVKWVYILLSFSMGIPAESQKRFSARCRFALDFWAFQSLFVVQFSDTYLSTPCRFLAEI